MTASMRGEQFWAMSSGVGHRPRVIICSAGTPSFDQSSFLRFSGENVPVRSTQVRVRRPQPGPSRGQYPRERRIPRSARPGGQMTPAKFRTGQRSNRPSHISAW